MVYQVIYGAGTKGRTRDLLITSQSLYQLSYTGSSGRILGSESLLCNKKIKFIRFKFKIFFYGILFLCSFMFQKSLFSVGKGDKI